MLRQTFMWIKALNPLVFGLRTGEWAAWLPRLSNQLDSLELCYHGEHISYVYDKASTHDDDIPVHEHYHKNL